MKTLPAAACALLCLSLLSLPSPGFGTTTVLDAYYPSPSGHYTRLAIGTTTTTGMLSDDNTLSVQGNIGIGTSNPRQPLDVSGNIIAANIGIGTTAPKETLDVVGKIAINKTIVLNLFPKLGDGNIAAGNGGQFNATIGAAAARGLQNTFIGIDSGITQTTGKANTALGYISLNKNFKQSNHTAIGSHALELAEPTSIAPNTAIGFNALHGIADSIGNVVIGWYPDETSISGTYNTAIGSSTMDGGDYNVAIGYLSGYNTTPNNSILIGANASSDNNSLNIRIGYGNAVRSTGPNRLNIGDTLFGTNIYNTSGNIGIGVVTPQTNLDVNGDMVTTGDFSIGTIVRQGALTIAGDVTVSGDVKLDTTGVNEATLKTTAAPAISPGSPDSNTFLQIDKAVNITAYANIPAGGGVPACTPSLILVGGFMGRSFYYSSDVRLKQDIHPITGALNKILALNGVTFAFKANPAKRQLGLIAQNVEKTVPEVVATGPDGMKTVAYSNLVALLIEGIKDQQKELADIAARTEKLEMK